jgi:hypothetical protein
VPCPLVASGVNCPSSRKNILEEVAFHPPPQPQGQSRPTTAGQPYRLKIGPTFLSSVQNLHLTFASVRVIRGSISSSRRWRQVGRPRRVSPTVLRAPRHIRQSRSYHRREQSFAHSGVRSAERRPWSRSFAPLSPVPPEVEPYLIRRSRRAASGRAGPPWSDHFSDLQQSKINIHQSAILPPTTPLATSGRTTAGPALPF